MENLKWRVKCNRLLAVVLSLFSAWFEALAAEQPAQFRVATYNLENYILEETGNRKAKPEESRTRLQQIVLSAKPDVLAVQEIGPQSALMELQAALKRGGLDLPHWEHAAGFDTNIFVGVLSRFPILQRRSHTNEQFLLNGRRLRVSRAFAEVEIEVNPSYRFTLINAHLKSKRQSYVADESEMREQEARLLREKVEEQIRNRPFVNLVVVGDFNDLRDSKSVRTVIGRGKMTLIDTRPTERNGDNIPASNRSFVPRSISWTHFYAKEDTFSRIDYILLSQGMTREWNESETYIVTAPNWGIASDHRPLVATFIARDQ